MKIGIIADSHDHIGNLKKAMDVFRDQGVEQVLHAGDLVSPFVVDAMKPAGLPVTAVLGNNEGELLLLEKRMTEIGSIRKGPLELTLAGRKIALMHEPVYIEALKQSGKFDLIIYGHFHVVSLEQGPCIVINPGECCGYLTGKATVAVADLKTMEAHILDL